MKYLNDEDKARLVKEVIDNFDFQAVYKVMTVLNWKWSGKRPKIHEMVKKAEEYLYYVLNNDDCVSYGSGGFKAHRYEDEITLVFIAEDATAFFDED